MDIAFNKNEDLNKQEVDKLKHKLEKVYLGGGKKRLPRSTKKVNSQPENASIIW